MFGSWFDHTDCTGILYSLFGVTLTPGGIFTARQYGASLIGNMLVTWIGRNAKESDARRGIIWGLFFYDSIGFVITLIATLTGVLDVWGWVVVGLYLLLALGFGYFDPQPKALSKGIQQPNY